MKVKDLLSTLQKLDPEIDILCCVEDKNILPKDHLFMLFDIVEVNVSESEKCRAEDGAPSLKFGKSSISEPHVIIEITGDF